MGHNIIDMLDTTYRSYEVTVPNTELPVTIEQARFHLRNEDLHFDDDLLRAYIKAASRYVERTYGLALLTQTVKQYHCAFPANADTPLLLRIAPLLAITSIQYYNSAGALTTWPSDQYKTGTYNLSGFVVPKTGYAFPTDVENKPNAVIITYTAGFGSKPSSIDDNILQALRLMLTDMYQRREDTVVALPKASEVLLQSWYRFAA